MEKLNNAKILKYFLNQIIIFLLSTPLQYSSFCFELMHIDFVTGSQGVRLCIWQPVIIVKRRCKFCCKLGPISRHKTRQGELFSFF